MITVRCTVAPEKEPAFLHAMQALGSVRQRTGASRWQLYRDAERSDQFVKVFWVPSWEEHLRQHSGRLTVADQQIEEDALRFSDPPAVGDHWLPP